MKIKRVTKLLAEKKIDIALFYNLDAMGLDRNMYYLTNYKGVGCLVIPKKQPPFMIIPKMELERAKKNSNILVYEWEKGKKIFESIKELLTKKKIRPKTVGVDSYNFSIAFDKAMKKSIKKTRTIDLSKEMLVIRSQKTREEIINIRKSCKIADNIIKRCISQFPRFKTEKDVETFLHLETVKKGCELSFPTIVASGKSASMPHYEPKNVRLKKGFCVIDFGVKYKGYHSDITRTIYLGKPSKEEVRLYNLLLKIQKETINKIKKGMTCHKPYEYVQKRLGQYSENFTHGLGHGIGLQIHELPNLTSKSDETFKEGMIFTVEPGIYFTGKLGLRIEDDILIENGKTKTLTKTPKKLIIIHNIEGNQR